MSLEYVRNLLLMNSIITVSIIKIQLNGKQNLIKIMH